jgi:hypothetical protein
LERRDLTLNPSININRADIAEIVVKNLVRTNQVGGRKKKESSKSNLTSPPPKRAFHNTGAIPRQIKKLFG